MRSDLGPYVIAGVSLATALVFVYAMPDHVQDPTWPDHARNHVLQSLFWVVGLCVLNAVVALRPLQSHETWAKRAVTGSGGVLFGGYFLAVVVTGGGAPGLLDDVVFGVLAGIYAVGVILVYVGDPQDSA